MKSLLIDLDGVLYTGDAVIKGAVNTVNWLRENAIPHIFLTNTTSRPREGIHRKLHRLGISFSPDQILTPVIAASNWLQENTDGPAALFVPHSTKSDFSKIPQLPEATETGAASVVIGDLGEAWDFCTLNRAFRLLIEDHNPPLIALGMTRYWRAEDGLRLDVAPFIKALEYAIGREAIVLGKPARGFFDAALKLIDANTDDTFMIGDDIVGDIQGAQSVGMMGLLVKTGKFRKSDIESYIRPYAVIESISELPEWWAENVLGKC
jgi:HAD superfamily hydrolase (TIGR01458 family)